mmetsp:Transcript_30618/g.86603  ORF Transcript_30618/g.86603 Transcript_30618/m.86603 type:complete len:143 (+) Transcript_30618:1677-2105(+)
MLGSIAAPLKPVEDDLARVSEKRKADAAKREAKKLAGEEVRRIALQSMQPRTGSSSGDSLSIDNSSELPDLSICIDDDTDKENAGGRRKKVQRPRLSARRGALYAAIETASNQIRDAQEESNTMLNNWLATKEAKEKEKVER